MIARLAGVISAPPTPCTARAAMSQPMPGAAAHSTDARVNQVSPARNTRRRPQRSLVDGAAFQLAVGLGGLLHRHGFERAQPPFCMSVGSNRDDGLCAQIAADLRALEARVTAAAWRCWAVPALRLGRGSPPVR
jgi:hypothetical protein